MNKGEKEEWPTMNAKPVDCELISGAAVPPDWNKKMPKHRETARPT
jgi:hypothetical protein